MPRSSAASSPAAAASISSLGRLGRLAGALGQRRLGVARVHDEQVGVAERRQPAEQVVAHLDAVAGARDDAGERGTRVRRSRATRRRSGRSR